MGLKPDHWIKQMALEHSMIDPFVEGQIRDGVISFGVSSYGYDIRVADEFKIFQPEITAAKLSDMQRGYIAGLVDGQGYVGILPPNSDGYQAARLAFSSPNRPLLENVRSMIGTGQLGELSGQRTTGFQLVITRPADIQYVLSQVFPYLTDKQSAAAAVLDHLKSTKSIVVDPKNFDPQSFVDFRGSECIIPPNSFALARTIEYFRIPRSVLTICVGKSTYARCGIIVNVTPFEPEWEGFVTLEISNTTPLPAKIYANEGIAQVLFFYADEDCAISYADKKGKYQSQQEIVLPKL
jgi:deoxycytidine triphosphate deaminase